jgi:hypothetical protein
VGLRVWLAPGAPRRLFVAGGSDAHGDLNYRRTGYFTGTASITDVAIGKVRNLVLAGAPDLPVAPGQPPARHSHDRVVGALAAGNFAVTDGPALRIVVDRNRNGVIDDADTPMGGVVQLHRQLERELPIIVEWRSSIEFGPVTGVSIYVGAARSGMIQRRVYAPERHGPRTDLPWFDDSIVPANSDARTYALMEDNYWRDPTLTGILRPVLTAPPALTGTYRVSLPLNWFKAADGVDGDRFYVRAFARTAMKDRQGCLTSMIPPFGEPGRLGACERH